MTDTMTATIPATPAKLQDGTWGARCTAPAAVGDTVQITTRGGKTWTARVIRVVWSGEGVTLCATQGTDRPAPTRSSAASRSYRPVRGRDYCGYPCPVDGHRCTADRPCHDCM